MPWAQEAPGSNPGAPTTYILKSQLILFLGEKEKMSPAWSSPWAWERCSMRDMSLVMSRSVVAVAPGCGALSVDNSFSPMAAKARQGFGLHGKAKRITE